MESSVHFFEPAFRFAEAALAAARAPEVSATDPARCLAELRAFGARALPESSAASAEALPVLAVREFAPAALSDGAWLRGAVFANAIESDVGMLMLRQLIERFGFPGRQESFVQRYIELLAGLGIGSAAASASQVPAGCSDAAYEHALLGLCLGLFPSSFGPETLGFNLWKTSVGPCPLLEHALRPALLGRGACLRYFDRIDRVTLLRWAEEAVTRGFEGAPAGDRDETFLGRVAVGFAAARASYERWQAATFALAAGADAVPLVGTYTPPREAAALEEFARQRYGRLSHTEQYYYMANADLHPAVSMYGKVFVEHVLGRVAHAFATDERLNSKSPPPYSERTAAAMVAEQQLKNVRSRLQADAEASAASPAEPGPEHIGQIFDGFWLQGYADVYRAGYEEYGWLFGIYASEHGEGDLNWNHSRIFRRALANLGPDVMLDKSDPRLYRLFEIRGGSVAQLAASLNTLHFMPELLGMNLGIEATGVAGNYLINWKKAQGEGAEWKALAARLHNSIDNYADGHTKMSLEAVQSYMRRVKDVSPELVESHWKRVWTLWRCQDILTHGTESERAALSEHFDIHSLGSV